MAAAPPSLTTRRRRRPTATGAFRAPGPIRTLGTAALAAVLAVTATGTVGGCGGGPDPDAPLRAFVKAWGHNDLSKLSLLDDGGGALPGAQAQQKLVELVGDLAGVSPKLSVKREPKPKHNDATATIGVVWPLAGGLTWQYESQARLHRDGDAWKVIFEPAVVHPELTSTTRLAVTHTASERSSVLDGSGQPIVTKRPVVVVGLQPSQVKDVTATVAEITTIINKVEPGLTFPDLPDRLKAAKPDAFVDVVTLRREKYDQIRPQLQAMEATHFQETQLPLAPSSAFARALLGSTGEVTKEIMDKNPGKYQIGDLAGLSGLQQRYDDTLRGVPGTTITIKGAGQADGRQVFTSQPKPGTPVKTTLDQTVQNAADAALAGQTLNTALVAIRISDGAVLAVANGTGGPNKGQLDLALTAQVPPGSTMKTVTALGVLDNGSAKADTVVPCPKTITVGGTSYKNYGDEQLGDVPLHVDFAKSCNTAFASLAPKLGADGLAKTAATLGIGTPWDLGVDAYSGKVSSGGSPEEQAAAAFGQGTTTISPIAMASAAAAVARGQFKQPRLLLEPAPAKPAADGPALRPESLTPLRAMMREVVTDGTATALKGSGEVYGKTGTAEFDTAHPDKTHSWFMGYRGDVAFAVLVEAGGVSTDVAVPLAAKFLSGVR